MESLGLEKILIDSNIVRNAITHRSYARSKKLHWGPNEIEMPVLEREACPPREDETSRLEQLPYLATISELAKANKLKFFSSFELSMERGRQHGPGHGYVGLNLFEGINMAQVDPPISRTIIISAFKLHDKGLTKSEQMEFYRSIQSSRYLALRNFVGDAHMDDTFHLWTAEISNLHVFLSMDMRFINVMNHQGKKANSTVLVLSPKGLCECLGEGPTDIEGLSKRDHPFR